MNKHYEQWIALRKRIAAEERAFAMAREARDRGEPRDVVELSVQWSEIRALRALSVSLVRRAASEMQHTGREPPIRGATYVVLREPDAPRRRSLGGHPSVARCA